MQPDNAHCFWSAAEDGRVHQFDVRARGDAEPDARNMLVRSPHTAGGRPVEFKSLDINKARTEFMHAARLVIDDALVEYSEPLPAGSD